jgi:brefeldin A-inhibited guanine nucleotide-exchange protein
MVNGLLKTAQGVPPGVATTLLPPQELTMKLEAMKCLVAILRSMGDWMNKQLRIPDSHSAKKSEAAENGPESGSLPIANGNGDESVEASDSHSEASSEASDVSTIEQRRAYKLELQVREYVKFGMQAYLSHSHYVVLLLPVESNVNFVAGRYISF